MALTSETQRVAQALARRIRAMQPGDTIGSVRSIAGDHEVGHDVARKALALLVRHGLVRAEARRHVVADPAALLGVEDAIARHTEEIAELRGEISALRRRIDDMS